MNTASKLSLNKIYPLVLVVGGALGFAASFILTLEKITLLQNPTAQLSCNLNPIFSCSTIILTPQAVAFGFPNALIGITSFAVLITIGMAIIAGATFKRWFWLCLEIGTILGLAFVHWLIFEALYRINALCLYCMVVWVVVIAIFWYTTLFNLEQGNIKTPVSLKGFVAFLQRHNIEILLLWFLIIIGLILQHFWYFFKTQL